MKVDHEKGIVSFKSWPSFFAKEKDGRKNNTIRILSSPENDELWDLIHNHDRPRIQIISNIGRKFDRLITDISDVGHINGKYQVAISWADPRLELCEGIEAENIRLSKLIWGP